ncbi:dynamin [Ktedonosporobacter rubrisoli]|uniref:Dynamin n=1 Tax=Ktedonosporobacter rubrisoli TaxID=2509675 RepID=A0A4P6JV89_KTERU|nr:dynamin family protein [Ktedonosporobacter rubrisoli]QBD79325.1 dynamin [Ktedonosporobacter rubrisoli]
MVKVVLQEQQRALLQRERSLASELEACLVGFEGADAYTNTLRQLTTFLDDLFLLVIVGEFNAGKSACINALLHQEVLEEGVIPTTHQITTIRYGEEQHERLVEQGVLEIQYPADFLQDISIVDTPGVNAVLREHEQLTEDFIPRSDLILFVTSVDRPFTQSERVFLERIRAWGKKVIIILNKIDLLRTPKDLAAVMNFVSENCKHLLGFEAQIFPVSAMLAQQARSALGHTAVDLWQNSRFGALEEYLFCTLDQAERVRLKLLSPLGVMQRLLSEINSSIEQRTALLTEDAHTVETIDEQLQLYREDMEQNFAHRLSEIENIILEMRARGDRFFDESIRLGRIFDLIQGERIRQQFEHEVIGDSAARIDQTVQELIDWLVEHEHRLWQDIMEYLERRRKTSVRRDNEMIGSVGRQFDYNRRTLLQSVARTASSVVQTYDRQTEAVELSQDLRSAVTQAAIAGASGIGLGAAIVAFVGTAAADVSGILAGAVILSLGLYIIPARRKRAKRSFEAKMDELRLRLRHAMTEQFQKELNNALNRVNDAIAPYTRFVRAEQKKTAAIQEQVNAINSAVTALHNEIEQIGA